MQSLNEDIIDTTLKEDYIIAINHDNLFCTMNTQYGCKNTVQKKM